MRNRFLAVFLALIVFVHPLIPSASAAEGNTQSLTQQQVTEALLALQTDFPEGMIWTNQSPATAYIWAFRGTVVAMSGCAAFAAIADGKYPFISRGDNSGTHTKELSLWPESLGITAEPESYADYTEWYTSANAGMGACLVMAEEMGAYILTDKATFLTFVANDGVMD